MKIEPQDMAGQRRWTRNIENLHIVVEFWPLKTLTTTYCVICMSSVESCLCLKAPRAFPRGRLLLWVAKSDGYIAWFYSNIDKKSSRNPHDVASGINIGLSMTISSETEIGLEDKNVWATGDWNDATVKRCLYQSLPKRKRWEKM